MSRAALEERRLLRLIEVGRGLVSELDPEIVLERVLEAARDLTGARYAALGVLNEDRSELERFLYLGIDSETRAKIGDLPRGRGVLGLLIDEPKPLRLSDVGAHPRSFGFPPSHPPMATFLGIPILIRGEAFGNLYLTEKADGREFDEADEEAATVLAGWVAIAVENARLYERAEGRRLELERAVHGLEAMSEIALAVGGETDLERILEIVVKRARAYVEAHRLVLMLREGEELVLAAGAGELGRGVVGRRIPVEGSLSGQILRSGRTERVHELSKRLLLGSPNDYFGTGAETGLFVPMIYRGRAVGVLIAADRLTGDGDFTEDDADLLASFAASAATAVATARSGAEERPRHRIAAAERERSRWARELHDETLQALGARRVLLSNAIGRGDPELLEAVARDVVEQLGEEIDKLRGLITELRPAVLDQIGLGAAIEELAERMVVTEGVQPECEISLAREQEKTAERLEPELESAVYRVVQEALTNIAKHARAERVELRVVEENDRLEIAVIDDGVGFDPGADTDGFGVLGMRERVTMVGGSIELTSTPGSGTRLRAVLPVTRARDGEHPRAA
jgi:two-component system, NarL family, sensor histidine kinase DevS